jgi:hypothetical protein
MCTVKAIAEHTMLSVTLKLKLVFLIVADQAVPNLSIDLRGVKGIGKFISAMNFAKL